MSDKTNDKPSPSQIGWIRVLLFERGIEKAPEDVAPTSAAASKFIKACLPSPGFPHGRVGTILPITDDQVEKIRALEAKLGPAPDGVAREMPTNRAEANKRLRTLGRVEWARENDENDEALRALGLDIVSRPTKAATLDTADIPV